jgi:hypothetical protein
MYISPNHPDYERLARGRATAEGLEGVAKHYRTTVAGVIDRTLSEWTEANGYPTRPPERLP